MGGEAYPKFGEGNVSMYYVIQVAPREELRIENLIFELNPDGVCRQCFHMMRHVRRKFNGEWHDVHEKLLPGYVFIETDSINEIHKNLKKTGLFTKILGRDRNSDEFIPLNDEEVAWIINMIRDGGEHEVPLSKVFIADDGSVEIVSGPLKHMQKLIMKIYLHKRLAKISTNLAGQIVTLHLGIEIMNLNSLS